MTTPANRNAVDLYYIAAGKFNRQFNRLLSKPVAKWKDADFSAISAVRDARNVALERLSPDQYSKVFGQKAAKRRDDDREATSRFEQAARDLANSFQREVAV